MINGSTIDIYITTKLQTKIIKTTTTIINTIIST